MADLAKTVGRQIREARKELGWDQEQLGRELAKLLGKPVSKQVVSKLEIGGREVTASELVALGLVLDRTLGWFLVPRFGETLELLDGQAAIPMADVWTVLFGAGGPTPLIEEQDAKLAEIDRQLKELNERLDAAEREG